MTLSVDAFMPGASTMQILRSIFVIFSSFNILQIFSNYRQSGAKIMSILQPVVDIQPSKARNHNAEKMPNFKITPVRHFTP